MSKKPSGTSTPPSDLPTLYLDENIGSPMIAKILREFPNEWNIRRHREHFRRRAVKDPQVIALCASRGWGIISSDDDMWFLHKEALRVNGIRLFTFTNGNFRRAEYMAALIFARQNIIEFMKMPGPFCGRIHKNGFTTITRGDGSDPLSLREAKRLAYAEALTKEPAS